MTSEVTSFYVIAVVRFQVMESCCLLSESCRRRWNHPWHIGQSHMPIWLCWSARGAENEPSLNSVRCSTVPGSGWKGSCLSLRTSVFLKQCHASEDDRPACPD